MKFKKTLLLLATASLVLGCNEVDEVAKELNTFKRGIELFSAPVPEAETVSKVVTLQQGWDKDTSLWFWHVPQGTAIMPYEWFLALEQPSSNLIDGLLGQEMGLFTDSAYMARFGFLPSVKDAKHNPDGLPIGFAKDDKFYDPTSSEPGQNTFTVASVTCAACHTGQLNYQGTGILIDGTGAMAAFDLFMAKTALALAETLHMPDRFNRFAKRVNGANATAEQNKALKTKLDALLNLGNRQAVYDLRHNTYATQEGFGRLDALARIGNFVFGTELDIKNTRKANAPVSLPQIWTVPWLGWAQYTGAIRQPMVRNAGEALGVKAFINLTEKKGVLNSTVRVDNLHAIEQALEGGDPFKDKKWSGLRPPQWPEEILGGIDQKKAHAGKKLYAKHCSGCHHPALNDPAIWQTKNWEQPSGYTKRRYLKTPLIPLEEIGTDPYEAIDFFTRYADASKLFAALGAPNPGDLSAADGLQIVAEKAADKWYYANVLKKPFGSQLTAEEEKAKAIYYGDRENIVLKPLAYRARPLDGVWTSPPFLHNGSVRTLYDLLSPASEREKSFWLGTREFDPVHVGYLSTERKGYFKLDTSHKGNSNAGHSFEKSYAPGIANPSGVIGPELTKEERFELIEYLKTI